MDPLEVARRHDDAWNSKDAAARKELCAPDIEVELPGGMLFHGVEQVKQMEDAFWEALPDSQIKRLEEHVAGDTVISEGVASGTHTGSFRTPQAEIPASGNPVNMRFASVKRIADGKIVSEHLYFDQLEFMMQLGALPAPPSS